MEIKYELQRIGYWSDWLEECEHYPDPSNMVDLGWSESERFEVATYLQNGIFLISFLGFSFCRFRCGVPDKKMGSSDLTDGVWVWPEGLAHYVELHSVKLPSEFLEHIKANNFQIPSHAASYEKEIDYNEITIRDDIWMEFAERNSQS